MSWLRPRCRSCSTPTCSRARAGRVRLPGQDRPDHVPQRIDPRPARTAPRAGSPPTCPRPAPCPAARRALGRRRREDEPGAVARVGRQHRRATADADHQHGTADCSDPPPLGGVRRTARNSSRVFTTVGPWTAHRVPHAPLARERTGVRRDRRRPARSAHRPSAQPACARRGATHPPAARARRALEVEADHPGHRDRRPATRRPRPASRRPSSRLSTFENRRPAARADVIMSPASRRSARRRSRARLPRHVELEGLAPGGAVHADAVRPEHARLHLARGVEQAGLDAAPSAPTSSNPPLITWMNGTRPAVVRITSAHRGAGTPTSR